jgi:hypothetical protein
MKRYDDDAYRRAQARAQAIAARKGPMSLREAARAMRPIASRSTPAFGERIDTGRRKVTKQH